MRVTDPRAQAQCTLLVTMTGCLQFRLGSNDAFSTERTGENQFSHWAKFQFSMHKNSNYCDSYFWPTNPLYGKQTSMTNSNWNNLLNHCSIISAFTLQEKLLGSTTGTEEWQSKRERLLPSMYRFPR